MSVLSEKKNCVRLIQAGVFICLVHCGAGAAAQTPPVQPKVRETPLPPAVTIPAPPELQSVVPNRPLTADEAAAIALYRQPDISTAASNILAAQGRKQQAQSALLPTVTAGTGYTNTAISPSVTGEGGSISTATAQGYQVTANLRQLIFDFNHTRDLVREASARISAASANYTRVQADTVVRVKQAFYTYAQNRLLVTVNESNVESRRSQLDAAKARLNAGLGIPADVVRAETAVAQAIQTLTVARNNALISGTALAELMGIDPRTPIEPADAGEQGEIGEDLNLLVESALANRPEIRQIEFSIRAAGYGISAARTSNAPSIGASVGWLQKGSDFPPDNNSLVYGFSLQWTPFDSGLTQGRVKEAQAELQAFQAEYEKTRLGIVSEVSQAYVDYHTALQRVDTAQAEVANAEESLRLIQGRYQAGLGTFLDVLDAQTALVTAQSTLVNARFAVERSRATITYAVGATNLRPARPE